MKNKNQKLVPIILVSLSCFLFITAIVLLLGTNHFQFSNQVNSKESEKEKLPQESDSTSSETNSNSNLDQIENNINSNLESNQNNGDYLDNNMEVNKPIIEDNEVEITNGSNSNLNETTTRSETNVISYFESQGNMLSENSNQEDRSLREKAKDSFITMIDFIFYDKEVKGYTFKELTTAAKLKVIKLALTIDHKIDSYFPDYKEVIKDKYTSFKGKLALKYLEFTSYLCETVGENTCNQAQEDFNTMKESFGFTWQFIRELATSGSSKVKDFYESWRDSN